MTSSDIIEMHVAMMMPDVQSAYRASLSELVALACAEMSLRVQLDLDCIREAMQDGAED